MADEVLAANVRTRLMFRSQFVLSPRFLEGFEGWNRVGLGRGLFLTVHPDLEVGQISHEKQWITLLGYILDPVNPQATNADLLSGLLRELGGGADLLASTSRFGGRWVLIVCDGVQVKLFHDALGLRQVCYTDVRRAGELWCTSEPKIVADMLRLQKNVDALELVASDRRTSREYRLPGEASAYVGMKRLLPNHYLDLSSGRSHRYWPVRSLEPLEFEECVERSSEILQGLMAGAARRFNLAISLTAGRDSRLVLASARQIADEASYVTVAKPQSPSDDVEVPARLLRSLRLPHDVIPWPTHVDGDFASVFRENVSLPHEAFIPEAQAVFGYNGLTKVAVMGSGGEYGRPRSRRSRFGADGEKALTPENLSVRAKMGNNKLAIESFRAWLDEVPRFRSPQLLDLCLWETGSWLAMTQLEFDIAWRDILTPYNCRLLLAGMMSLDRNLRCGPRFRLFGALMSRLWPELLAEPFLHARRHFILSPQRIGRTVDLLRKKIS